MDSALLAVIGTLDATPGPTAWIPRISPVVSSTTIWTAPVSMPATTVAGLWASSAPPTRTGRSAGIPARARPTQATSTCHGTTCGAGPPRYARSPPAALTPTTVPEAVATALVIAVPSTSPAAKTSSTAVRPDVGVQPAVRCGGDAERGERGRVYERDAAVHCDDQLGPGELAVAVDDLDLEDVEPVADQRVQLHRQAGDDRGCAVRQGERDGHPERRDVRRILQGERGLRDPAAEDRHALGQVREPQRDIGGHDLPG